MTGNNNYVWVRKDTLARLEGIANNQPQLRVKKGVTSPRLYVSGSGSQSTLCLDLPASSPMVRQSSVSSSSTFPCKIVSKEGAFYNVTKYEDGIDSSSTGTAKVYVLGLNFADTLPAGTWIVASESQIGTTGGGNVP